MTAVEALILRHYFELQGFLVRQCLPKSPNGAESLQIVNPVLKKQDAGCPPILFSSDLQKIHKALVWLPSWGALKISPTLLKSSAELSKFIDKRLAERKRPAELEEGEHLKIVVVPAIPMDEPYRGETIALLQARGVSAMLSLRSVIQDLIVRQDIRHPQEGLQLLQILVNFDLLKTTQMELFNDDRRK